MAAVLKTRFVGICPVCEGEFRLHNGKMVHHGYRRPGHGFIVGDCFAVGYEPYEVTTKGCILYRAAVAEEKGRLEGYLTRLENGEVRELHVERRKGWGEPPEMVKVSADSEDAAERAKFASALHNEISHTKSRIANCGREIDRMTHLIGEWAMKPIRTFEEAAAEQDAKTRGEREAKRAALEAKRAAARAKRGTLDAKKKAREDEKLALIAKYKGLYETLAKGLESLKDRQECARGHWRDMVKTRNKKGYLHFYDSKLECDEALVTLGLAKKTESGGRPWTSYARDDGHVY